MQKITRFAQEYAFLSNFWLCPIVFEGRTYGSVEAAYQAAKTVDEGDRSLISKASPAQAKRLGRHVTLRPEWESIKFRVMTTLVLQKFTQHPELAALLLGTGDVYLEEGNTWGDHIWGVCGGVGTNYLGIILMEVRKNVRERRTQAITAVCTRCGEGKPPGQSCSCFDNHSQ